MSEKLANYINSISGAASPAVKEKLEHIEMKDQFKEPELGDQSWLEVAHVLHSLSVHELASLIKAQAVEVSFTDEEVHVIGRALTSHKKDIERAMNSEKVNATDKEVFKKWEVHRENASQKVTAYILDVFV
ncbi:hypothetical protein ACIFOE_04685 [Paenibacillus sp. NRS-1783]|uniref:hypothetical protein n=1 Tax=Paenibacillus sp. NRS-1783 TaxID=3233907 RepID=UPI003D29EEA1